VARLPVSVRVSVADVTAVAVDQHRLASPGRADLLDVSGDGQ